MFKDLVSFLIENGGLNLPLIILGLIILFLFFQYVSKKFDKKTSSVDQKDLLLHDLFIKSDKYNRIVDSSNFGDRLNNEIFKSILRNKIDSTLSMTKSIIDSTDLNSLKMKELESKLYENNRKIMEDYNARIKFDFIDKYGVIGEKVFDLVMEHPDKGFNSVHSQELDHLDSLVSDVICRETSLVFNDNKNRFELYMYMLNSNLYVSMLDAETTFFNFNGDLDILKKAILAKK